jgi:hypothetical protein
VQLAHIVVVPMKSITVQRTQTMLLFCLTLVSVLSGILADSAGRQGARNATIDRFLDVALVTIGYFLPIAGSCFVLLCSAALSSRSPVRLCVDCAAVVLLKLFRPTMRLLHRVQQRRKQQPRRDLKIE